MPHVKLTVGDLTCVRQADQFGKDDVYWIANLRQGRAVNEAHTGLSKLSFDTDYDSSLPELVSIGAGETRRFNKSVIYDKDCPAGATVFGTIHFMERDTPLANYFAKILQVIGIIVIGLIVGAAVGFGVGFGIAGLQGAIGGGVIVVVGVVLVGFFIGALFELIGADESDAHLGGMQIVVGPLGDPPPGEDGEVWPLTMIPAGKLDVVDAHGAELIVYESSHVSGPTGTGHKYEASLKLEITGGHRASDGLHRMG